MTSIGFYIFPHSNHLHASPSHGSPNCHALHDAFEAYILHYLLYFLRGVHNRFFKIHASGLLPFCRPV